MWLSIDKVEREPLERLLACGTLEAMDVPDDTVGVKSIADDRKTARSADRALLGVVVELAEDLVVEFEVSTVREGHFAHRTDEALRVPVKSVVLVVVVLAVLDWLATALAHQGWSEAVGVLRAERTTVVDSERPAEDAVAGGTTEVLWVPDLAHGIDLGASDDGLTALCASGTTSLPTCWAVVLTLNEEVLVRGESLVACATEEVLGVECIAIGGNNLLKCNSTSTMFTDGTIWPSTNALTRLNGAVHHSQLTLKVGHCICSLQ